MSGVPDAVFRQSEIDSIFDTWVEGVFVRACPPANGRAEGNGGMAMGFGAELKAGLRNVNWVAGPNMLTGNGCIGGAGHLANSD